VDGENETNKIGNGSDQAEKDNKVRLSPAYHTTILPQTLGRSIFYNQYYPKIPNNSNTPNRINIALKTI
jgi:hypothetical protein